MNILVQVVKAVQQFSRDAKAWITPGFYRYSASPDACDECADNDEVVFEDDFIPDVFPWCEPSSSLIVFPMVHPNCRCQLIWVKPKLAETT